MSEELATYELDGDTALIGLNRPEKCNCINEGLRKTLAALILRANQEAKCGIIFGHGKHFCSGLDLAEAMQWINADSDARLSRRGLWHPMLDSMARGSIPFIAALKGATVGGGLEIASAAHLRVADESTFFALPEGQRGIFVGGGGSVRIQRLIGYARMADLMLTGRVLTAAEGERFGLCQYVTPNGESLGRAKSLARRIAKNAPLTNWAVSSCLNRVNDMSHDDGLFMETLISQAVRSQRSHDGLKDFLEHRAESLVEPGQSGDGGEAMSVND